MYPPLPTQPAQRVCVHTDDSFCNVMFIHNALDKRSQRQAALSRPPPHAGRGAHAAMQQRH